MLSTFICGSGSFHNEEQGDGQARSSPCTTPKRSRRNSFCRRHSSKDNPYSARGLDKFSALVADLEEKRQRIYSQLGSEEDAPLVRFVYSSSNDCVPIVVKLKDKKGTKNTAHDDTKEDRGSSAESSPSGQEVKKEPRMEPDNNKAKKRSLSWKAVMGRCRRPEYYFPAAVIMILVFLAVFGRSAAVLCTSLGWYLIPTLQGQKSKSMKKKEYTRRSSEKKMIIKSAGPSPPHKGRKTSPHLGNWKSFS